MKLHRSLSLLAVLCLAGAVRAQAGQPLTLVTAQSVTPDSVTATGRLQPVVSARLCSRLSGQMVELGHDADGHLLDAGMMVTRGQMLFRINDTTFTNAAAAADAALASATASLENLKSKTRDEQLEQLRQAIAELDLRIADKQKDYGRYQRLVEVDKTLPEKRLEEVSVELSALKMQRQAAAARLQEAENGPTKSTIAVAEARVKEAQVAVKSTQDDLRDTVINAPFDGLITRRFKSPGDYIAATPPTEVIELVSLDKLEVEFRLPESCFSRVVEGTTQVKLTSPLLKAALEARVTRVVREIDPAKGTFVCRTALADASRTGLLPGAFVTAEILLAATDADREVVIPQRAVLTDAGKAVVFVASSGKMERRVIEPGDRLTEGMIVKSGLRPGEKVVMGPRDQLKAGAPLPDYLTASVSSQPESTTHP